MRIMELEIVAKDGIEPSTCGFSVRQRASSVATEQFPNLKRPDGVEVARLEDCETGNLAFWMGGVPNPKRIIRSG
jgi:hypothetical protein